MKVGTTDTKVRSDVIYFKGGVTDSKFGINF